MTRHLTSLRTSRCRPVEIPNTGTHFFDCTKDEESCGFMSSRADEVLMEDVGLIARGPRPTVPGRTVTILSGITSRGVHGAALALTDSHVGQTNNI